MAENTQGVAVLPRDGYPVGVPCWIDTSQRDLEAARDFYGGLFGWEFQEWPSGRYLVASLDGLDVAGIALQPDDEPSWNTYIQVDSAEWATADALQLGGKVLVPAVRRRRRGPHVGDRRPHGRRLLHVGAEGPQRRAARERRRELELERSLHARPEPHRAVLPLPVRLGRGAGAVRRDHRDDVAPPRLRGRAGEARSRHPRAAREGGRAGGLHRRRRLADAERRPGALARDVLGRRHRRERGARRRARRRGARRAVRRRAGADRAAQGPAGGRAHDQPVRRAARPRAGGARRRRAAARAGCPA